jgi:hypothetical protein
MGDPGAGSLPDHKTLLLSGLLVEYLARLADTNVSPLEKARIRMALELQIESISALSPSTSYHLLRLLDGAFSLREDYSEITPAIDWYLDFLSGRSTDWLKEVSTSRLSQIWKVLPESPVRAKALRTLLFVESVTIPNQPVTSEICRLFRKTQTGGVAIEDLSGDQRTIASILVQEALGAPDVVTAEGTNIRFFSLRVLRYCLEPKSDVPLSAQMVAAVLASVGDLGEPVRKEFEATLTRSDISR